MPFKSKKQMKACFATNGFNGKIDCKEWANKSLPKKSYGGTNMYRPKNCKKCGGKMQVGGPAPSPSVYTSQAEVDAANRYAKDLAMRQGNSGYMDVHVARKIGDPRVQMIDSQTGLPATPRETSSGITALPSGITLGDVFPTSDGSYGYMDPQKGTFVRVNASGVYDTYGQVNSKRVSTQSYNPEELLENARPSFNPQNLFRSQAIPASSQPLAIRMKGGYLQSGGFPGLSYPDPVDASPFPEEKRREIDRIQEGINKGIIEGRYGENPQAYYDMVNSPVPQPQMRNNMTPQQLGITLQGLRTGLGYLSGAVERRRQNQNDYDTQTALGQMNAMPSTDFQPNPYSLYAKYGGKLKNYQLGGGASTIVPRNLRYMRDKEKGIPSYAMWFKDRQPNKQDSLTYKKHWEDYYYGDPKARFEWDNLAPGMPINDVTIPPPIRDSIMNMWSAYSDAEDKLPDSRVTEDMQNIRRGYDKAREFIPTLPPIKRQTGGIQPSYNFSNVAVPTSNDSASYRANFQNILNADPYAINDYMKAKRYGTVLPYEAGDPRNKELFLMQENKMNAQQDAFGKLKAMYQNLRKSLPMLPAMKYGGLKNHNYFGPPFSNGASMKFSDREQVDRAIIARKLIPQMFGFYTRGKSLYRGKGGNI